MKKIFRPYMEINESITKGFTVTKVTTGINSEGSDMMLELLKDKAITDMRRE